MIKNFQEWINEGKKPTVKDFVKSYYKNQMIFDIDGYEIIYDKDLKPIQIPYYPGDNKLSDAKERKEAKKKVSKYLSGFKKLVKAGLTYFADNPRGFDIIGKIIRQLDSETLIEFGDNKTVTVEIEKDFAEYILIKALEKGREIFSTTISTK